MNNKNEVFEYLIDCIRHQVNNNPYKQQCEDLAHEVQSLKNQLRDASAQIKELHLALVKATGDAEAYKLIRTQEQSGCRKEDTKECEHDWRVVRYAAGVETNKCRLCGEEKEVRYGQSGCRKEDTQVAEPWVKWEGGECPVPKDTIVQIRMRDGTSACEPGVAGELRWDHRGWRGDITCYRVVKPECEHEWQFYGVGFPRMCIKCGLKR